MPPIEAVVGKGDLQPDAPLFSSIVSRYATLGLMEDALTEGMKRTFRADDQNNDPAGPPNRL